MTGSKIILHATVLSGHGHRVELLLLMLGLSYTFSAAPAEVRKTEAFKRLNPLGQIPVLQDGDLAIADSAAIMTYLVKKYAPDSTWMLNDPEGAAEVQRWLSVAAGEIMHGPATARMIAQWGFAADPARAAEISSRLLAFMEQHLNTRVWLAARHATIADLACYSYVAHAPEGGVSLDPYPAVNAWLLRVEGLPKFKPMPKSPLPAKA
jgi:glutathione S-transferase